MTPMSATPYRCRLQLITAYHTCIPHTAHYLEESSVGCEM